MKIRNFFKRLFSNRSSLRRAYGFEKYLRSVETLMELENTGTLLIDHRRPGVVVALEYFTMWNECYVHNGDDRVLHAWCDKFRAAINLRRGKRYGANGDKFPPVMPSDPLYITIVKPEDYSVPYIIGYETPTDVEFKYVKSEE